MVFCAAVGFGTIGIFAKLGTGAALNNTTLLAFRFVLATAVLAGYLRARGSAGRPEGRELAAMVGLGVPFTVLTGAFFWGLLRVPAGLATITLYTYPVYVYAISAALLDERLNAVKLLALVLAVSGIGVIVGLDTAGADPEGLALVSVAALGYAVYTTGNRIAVGSVDADRLAFGAMATTGAFVVAYGLLAGTLFLPTTTEQWGVIVGLSMFGTVLPILLFVRGLRYVEASRASVVATVEPVVTVGLGALVLGERLSAGLVGGGGLVLVGVLLVRWEAPERPAEPRAD